MSNIVTLNNAGQAVTTSLAIADGVGNSHATVIKLIRQNASDLEEFGVLDFKSESTGGRPTEYAMLNEQQSTLLLTYMRNNDVVREFKKRLVKAFFELAEQRPAQQFDPASALNDPATMRSLLLGYTEKVLALEDQIKVIQPKAEALDRLALSDGSECITVTAKLLQVQKPKLLFGFMSKERWIYRRSGSTTYVGYQDKIQQGLLEHKITEITRSDGTSKITQQVRVTPKGLAKLAEMLAKDGLIK